MEGRVNNSLVSANKGCGLAVVFREHAGIVNKVGKERGSTMVEPDVFLAHLLNEINLSAADRSRDQGGGERIESARAPLRFIPLFKSHQSSFAFSAK